MKNWLAKLSRKSIILLAIIALLTCSGVAYGANQIVVHFGGGVGVSGTIHVSAPAPTTLDVVIVTAPDFAFTAGSTTPVQSVIVVQNNSAYALTLLEMQLSMDGGISFGTFAFVAAAAAPLPAHSNHSIPVQFIPSSNATAGDFNYSGSLTYGW